jgi:zinc protease
MKSLLSLFVLFCLSLAAAPQKEVDPSAAIVHYRLPNGMQVYLLSDPKSQNTSIDVSVKVGMDVENDETAGISHLVEHMVFRDARVPHRDYADYIKDEGGTYVNGYTKRYETEYTATIGSDKSYWIAGAFATMLLDKNVTNADLKSEKGAVQTEIGEYKLPERIVWDTVMFFRKILPPQQRFYQQQFGLPKRRELAARYYSQLNNPHFTLEQVMRHYRKYYYPANMTLEIAGNFDVARMEKKIAATFGAYRQTGSATVVKPHQKPRENHKAARRFYEGTGKNAGYIGAKYLLEDYKQYLIVDAYTANLASRLQKQLRNKMGQNYGVQPDLFSDRKAGVASVYFDGLRKNFEDNVAIVKAQIAADAASLDDKTIDTALREYREQNYDSVEHDSQSLMSLVETQKHLDTDYKLGGRTSFAVFSSITPEEFRKTVSSIFSPQNRYEVIYRDYYFFPYDILLWSLLATVLLVVVYFRLYRIDYRLKGLRFTKRDILLERRLSNRFLGFLMFLLVFTVSTVSWEWIKYLLCSLLTGNPYYLSTIDVPWSYVADIADSLLMIVVFALVYRYGFRYDARLQMDKEAIYLVGNRIVVLRTDEIRSIDVVQWHPGLFFSIRGLAIGFWRPLTLVRMKNGRKYYLRSTNAAHLKEDIEKNLEPQA